MAIRFRLLWQFALRAFSRPSENRKEDCCQDGNNGDDDQKLDQREPSRTFMADPLLDEIGMELRTFITWR